MASVLAATVAGCGHDPAMLIKITADAKVDQYDLYIRQDSSGEVVFHSGFNPVLAPGEKTDDESGTRDLTVEALKIAVKLSEGGKYTLLIVGVTGQIEGGKPAPGATQFFWAGHVDIDGANEIDARLLSVPDGDDADRDFWPDATKFPADKPEAAQLYAGHGDLLDCNDNVDNPIGPGGMALSLHPEDINPFTIEICGDGYDENCNGNDDDPCVDADGDGNPKGMDCDDADPARHKPNPADPFPDPPNCCGYSLGMLGTADEHKNFAGDPILCPKMRCGDGIDESCRGGALNDPANDTACVVDADCDGYPAPPVGDDCDDNDPSIHPGALEVCGNGKNESCSPSGPDSGCVPCDLDGDGYERNDSASGCPDATDQHPGLFDCNDNDAGVYPGASTSAGGKEGGVNAQGKVATALKGLCRRVYEPTGAGMTQKIAVSGYMVGDADCNGLPFESCPPASCDADGDGWPVNDCGTGQPGPYDCNDNDPTIFPTAPDKCGDGVDGSCAGADTPCNGMDKDGDGYLPPADCDDSNPNIHPFAVELCNGVDDDCDGDKDEGNPDPSGVPLVGSGAISTCTDDNDGECKKTLGRCVCSPTAPVTALDPLVTNRMSCPGFDAVSARVPHCYGAGQPHKQTCGATLNIDDDCDGRFDDPTGSNLAVKGMPCGLAAGVCKPGVVVGCVMTPSKTWYGATPPSDKAHWECSADTIPAALSESCNGFDDDCDGSVPGNEIDVDMDKYISCAGPCPGPFAGAITGCGDCNEGVASTHPNAIELCDNIDNNCANGVGDDGATDPLCAGKTCCSSQATCRNLQAGDPNNCGTCGFSCSTRVGAGVGQPADGCNGGACTCGGAAQCGSNFWCTGGACQKCDKNAHCGPNCTPCSGANVCKPDGSGCNECNVDVDCDATHPAGTFYCNGGNCAAKKGPGVGCTPNGDNVVAECGSTAPYCTDGVCCNKPPSMCGGCQQCNGGANGTCGNVPSGQDPHLTCNLDPANCSLATCNGANSCYAGNASVCGGPACQDNATESHTYNFLCQALNMCSATQNVTGDCQEYKCTAPTGVCRTTCTADNQCVKGHCWEMASGGDNHCYPKKVAGDPCTADADCNSGSCVAMSSGSGTGVCCGTTARPGSCPAGLVPPSETCTSGAQTNYSCSGANNLSCVTTPVSCNGLTCGGAVCNATCTKPAVNCTAGHFCANNGDNMCPLCTINAACGASCTDCTAIAPTCAGGKQTFKVCNGGGSACTNGTPQDCPGNYACNGGSACKNTCADDGDCETGYWCKSDGTCVLRGVNGSNSNCDDAQCKGTAGGTTCNQCADADHVTNLKTCAAGANNNKCD